MFSDRTELLISELSKRILVLDGAMGTMLQSFGLTEEDFRKGYFENHSKELKGNNDLLCLTRPDAVISVHEKYLDAGADIIETNTFNANSISQADYLLQSYVYDLNLAGAKLGRTVADSFTAKNPAKPRFVAGSIGPTGRTLSMSPDVHNPAYRNVSFDELATTYQNAAEGLIDGGADILLVETIFDTLNAKAAAFGIMNASQSRGVKIPVMFSATISDAGGRLLAGQNVEAFMISVLHTPSILSIGFNCALGPHEMRPHLTELASKCPCMVSAHPNAGLPDELGCYRQTPDEMGRIIAEFAREGYLNIVGGCCGTNPKHINAIANAVDGVPPRKTPNPKHIFNASGLDPLIGNDNVPFINVGERTNVAGSRKFLNLVKDENYTEAVRIARGQVENGALIIDVNMDDAMLDTQECMKTFLLSIASEPDIARVPIMIDSSRWEVIREGLKCVQGKCVVNSISLKEGELAFLEKAREARHFGAALLCMAFDENGQADTLEKRVAVCRRMYRLLTEQAGVPPEDIIFDPNVFAIATGMPEHDNYALDFIEAVRIIKSEMPLCHISGGISNVSFSFRGNEQLRSALHSVFLYHAIAAGLDMGIVNPGQLAIYEEIEPELRNAAEAVILNSFPGAAEKLLEIASGLKNTTQETDAVGRIPSWRSDTLEKRIEHALIKGDDAFISNDMTEALQTFGSPVEIIEGPLMGAMKQVGMLFGEGKMFLPQVVKTARVMKNAVTCLMPYMETAMDGVSNAGTIILATVKGDVHDIGKNIVGVVLQCNNYRIVDLGVMVPGNTILEAAVKENAVMIGLSGLITPSLEEMCRIAAEMERMGMKIPLLIGGAAASETHTALKIQPHYSGPVVYVPDASQSVPTANALTNQEKRDDFISELLKTYESIRIKDENKKVLPIIPTEEARSRSLKLDFHNHPPEIPAKIGIFSFSEPNPMELTRYINWRDFIHAWKLENPEAGKIKDILLDDAKKMLDMLTENNVLKISAKMAILPAASNGDNIEIYTDETREKILHVFPMLRQQYEKNNGMPDYSLADFIAPKKSGLKDYIGFFALSAGHGVEAMSKYFMDKNDDYSAILLRTLVDRLAEAYSEKLHQSLRKEIWAYAPEEELSPEQLFAMKYKGIRPAPGYPTSPDHSMKKDILTLLDPKNELNIKLTESYMMIPSASICGFYFAHPESCYFNIGRIDSAQLADYAKRRGITLESLSSLLSNFAL